MALAVLVDLFVRGLDGSFQMAADIAIDLVDVAKIGTHGLYGQAAGDLTRSLPPHAIRHNANKKWFSRPIISGKETVGIFVVFTTHSLMSAVGDMESFDFINGLHGLIRDRKMRS